MTPATALTTDTSEPSDVLNAFPAATQYVSNGNPSFWGGYVEAGYFLTGETRGYKAGAWDRTKVLKPFSKGGIGAVQVIGRVDYLDLDSSKLRSGCTNNFVTGLSCTTAASQASKGGKQLGLLAGLTWIPEDYMRVLLNYSHAIIKAGRSRRRSSRPRSGADQRAQIWRRHRPGALPDRLLSPTRSCVRAKASPLSAEGPFCYWVRPGRPGAGAPGRRSRRR